MDDRKKTKRKLFNIFEKDKICNSFNEIPHSDVKIPKFNLKLTARRRSTRLKSEIFVYRIPPDSPENDPYAFTKNDFEDTKLVYTPPKKKAKISKSPSFMERIDRYFNIQPSKASNSLSANSYRTALETTEEGDQKIDKTVHSKALISPKLKEYDDLQEYTDSFIDSIDTNAIVDMLNNTEIVEGQSQVKNENSNNVATPKKYNKKSNENLEPIDRFNFKETKVRSKENNNFQKRKAKSNTSKKNENVVESSVHSIQTNAIIDMVNNSEIIEENSHVQNEISNCNTTPKTHHTSKKRDTKPKENFKTIVSFKKTERKVSCKENKILQTTKTRSKISKNNQNDEDRSHTLQSLRTRDRNTKFSAENDDSVGSNNNDALNITNIFNTQKKLQKSFITETLASPGKSVENKTSVSLRKRERRQTISSIQVDNNVTKANSSLQLSASLTSSTQKSEKNEITETNDSSQLPSASLTSSPQKTAESQISVPIRRRGRRPTISGLQMDNNVYKVTETNGSSLLPSVSLTSRTQKTAENQISVPIRRRGRRPTISGIQMDNNVYEITETNDSSQLPSASLTSSPQKTAENQISVPLRKRGRRPTISGIQMDANVVKATETIDSCQRPQSALTLSPRKTVENQISVTKRKRGRRQTICGVQMDNNVAEVTETHASSDLSPSALASNPQKTVENQISVPLRKRGRRPTISCIQMDTNVVKVTETIDSCQLPQSALTPSPRKTVENQISVTIRKRGRRQTICGVQMDNNVAEVTETHDSSDLSPSALTSNPQKTVENQISVPLRKRGRRPKISGIQMDNNVDEIVESNNSSQLPSASLTLSPQKSAENQISVPLRKRGRRQTICGTQMDNNVAEVTETKDNYQLPAASLPSSPQKSIENERSVSLRKKGRRPTISGIQIDNNVAELTKSNGSCQLPPVSLISSPEESTVNERSVPLRKRGRRQTICGIQMDNNVAEVTETNDSSQLPIKRGRRPTICQTKLENYFGREANKTVQSNMENQTEISSDMNVTKKITKYLNEKCNSKQKENIYAMAQNSSNEQNSYRISDNHSENLQIGSQQVKDQSRKPQKITSTDPNDNKVVEEPKRKRGRPRLSKSSNVAAEKQVKMRIQKINVAKKPKNTYGRLSKDKLNSANVRKIPKDRLDEVLDMLQNEDHEIWKDRNISCNAGIHRYWETRTMTSDQNMKMKYARQFLLRRDWLSLSKILCLSNQDAKNNIYYPLLVKYATLCLAHTDKEQFHKFVNSLITMADSSAIIKKCTKISRQSEE